MTDDAGKPGVPAERTTIKRGFVETSRGQLHYRVAGRGQPLILLHPTPYSSKRYLPLLPALARRRRVFALDTPGYGLSYRPAAQPTIDEYAAAIAEAINGLGYESAPLFGDLTGAIIAIATAAKYPEQVTALALGIIPYFAQAPGEAAPWRRNYPVAFHFGPPAEDGSHFLALFQRLTQSGLYRNRRDVPLTPEQITELVISYMEMRETAIWGFEAVFTCDITEEMRSLRCPILLAMTDDHGNTAQIARARTVLPQHEVVQGPQTWAVEEVCEFLSEVIPDFLEARGL